MATETSSLRLIEILSDEFFQLHGEAAPLLADDLISLKSATPGTFSYSSVIGQEGEAHSETGSTVIGQKESSFQVFRQKRLAEWTGDAKKQTKSLAPDNVPPGAEKMIAVIEAKIRQADLVYCEPWITDAPLRAFTRGLLEEYIARYPKAKPEKKQSANPSSSVPIDTDNGFSGGMAIASAQQTFDPGDQAAAKAVTVEQQKDAEKLNRLILEDVFPEYLERQDSKRLTALYKAMFGKQQNALCLSGGGIRSGTFALGIVQGLAQSGTSPKDFSYLSTVSGGGYLGGWLSAWIHQEGVDSVFKQLKPGSSFPIEPAPIRHLRAYSNYLSPLLGLFSADTWTLFAIYLRNLTINWLIIIPFLAGIASIPWLLAATVNSDPNFFGLVTSFILGAVFMIVSDLFTKQNPPIIQNEQNYDPGFSWQDRNQQYFLVKCLAPGCFGIFCWTVSWYWFLYGDFPDAPAFFQNFHTRVRSEWDFELSGYSILRFAIASLAFVIVEWVVFALLEWAKVIPERFNTEKGKNNRWKEGVCLLVAGALSGFLLITVARVMPLYNDSEKIAILYTSFAFPVFLLIILFNGFIYEGLKSTFVEDAEREWTARYSAWFLIVAFGWALAAGVILYGPVLVRDLLKYVFTVGAITSYLTAYLGQKLKSNGKPEQPAGGKKSALANVSLPVMAFIAIIILFIFLSFMDIALMGKAVDLITDNESGLSPEEAAKIPFYFALLVLAGLSVICLGFSFAIDMNRFSLHALYRSRLIRAYLGASRPEGQRRPDPFTGFDETDNMYMGDLVKKEPGKTTLSRPFHIVNVALNLVAGKNLAWQERKAASFTVSPLHAGSMILGYRKTYQDEVIQNGTVSERKGMFYGGDRGISLGTAMTISGAAVSPNSGYNTSPLVAFFMTLFNLRLGWWLGNPGPTGNDTFYRSSPKWGLKPVLSEMFGQTDEVNPYVFLSDGGHFENLGLYEMALRRNRFIILSDASCDEDCDLEDLGNAIRKIRIDLGIRIDFPKKFEIYSRKSTTGKDGKYWSLGRIRYPENKLSSTDDVVKFHPMDGVLLYVKPGIYGKESKDIFNYASVNKAFPHESTADQFFSESQFESYRALGEFAIASINAELDSAFGLNIANFIGASEQDWKDKIIPALNK